MSTPGSRKSLRFLNGQLQEDPDNIATAPPVNPSSSDICSDFRWLNINAEVYNPPPNNTMA